MHQTGVGSQVVFYPSSQVFDRVQPRPAVLDIELGGNSVLEQRFSEERRSVSVGNGVNIAERWIFTPVDLVSFKIVETGQRIDGIFRGIVPVQGHSVFPGNNRNIRLRGRLCKSVVSLKNALGRFSIQDKVRKVLPHQKSNGESLS